MKKLINFLKTGENLGNALICLFAGVCLVAFVYVAIEMITLTY